MRCGHVATLHVTASAATPLPAWTGSGMFSERAARHALHACPAARNRSRRHPVTPDRAVSAPGTPSAVHLNAEQGHRCAPVEDRRGDTAGPGPGSRPQPPRSPRTDSRPNARRSCALGSSSTRTTFFPQSERSPVFPKSRSAVGVMDPASSCFRRRNTSRSTSGLASWINRRSSRASCRGSCGPRERPTHQRGTGIAAPLGNRRHRRRHRRGHGTKPGSRAPVPHPVAQRRPDRDRHPRWTDMGSDRAVDSGPRRRRPPRLRRRHPPRRSRPRRMVRVGLVRDAEHLARWARSSRGRALPGSRRFGACRQRARPVVTDTPPCGRDDCPVPATRPAGLRAVVLPAGTHLRRGHQRSHPDPTELVPGRGDIRFAPLVDDVGDPVSHVYLAHTTFAALLESVLHDAAPGLAVAATGTARRRSR